MPTQTTTERREKYESLARKAEQMIQRSPDSYKLRIGALALLGYAVIWTATIGLLALLGSAVWAAFAGAALLVLLIKTKLIIALPLLLWVLVRALWVRIERPDGLRITAREAPALFVELKALSRTLRMPRIHEVLLNTEFNAAVVQSPRLGILGWQRNTLILGLPLMLALSSDEMQAVLAHEAGHLSGNHGRFGGRVYRMRMRWYQIMTAFNQIEGWGANLMRRFFDWYAPYFDAMSFALARANEYQADAITSEHTSREARASALLAAEVRGELAGEFYWKPLLARTALEPEPERAPFHGLARFHAEHEPEPAQLNATIERALAASTDYSNTHPALTDRLRAIQAAPARTFRVSRSVASEWLGDSLHKVLNAFNREWLNDNAEAWRNQYRGSNEARGELAELERRDPAKLEDNERWRRAELTEYFHGAAAALPIYRDYAERTPEDGAAALVIGRILLAEGQEEGMQHLEHAAVHFQWALEACELAYAHELRRGNATAAEQWRRRGEREIDLRDQYTRERSGLRDNDVFKDPGLSDEWLARLRQQLGEHDGVKCAWIARKQVRTAPELLCYVISVAPSLSAARTQN